MSAVRRRLAVILGICILTFVGIVVAWLALVANPVVYSYSDPAIPSLVPTFVILNPLRDRAPEQVAERILVQFKDGECEQAISTMQPSSSYSSICERESKYNLMNWNLRDRKDLDDIVSLEYELKRGGDYGSYGFVNVQKVGDRWKVIEFNFVY